MSQLLKITTTPIKIAVNVEQAHFEEVERNNAAKHEVQRQQRVRALQAKQQMDTMTSTNKPAAQAIQAQKRVDSYQATQTISASIPVEFASINNVMNMRLAQSSSQLSVESVQPAADVIQNYVTSPTSNAVGYVPSADDIKWEPSTLDLNLELHFNEDYGYEPVVDEGPERRFVPRKISFEVEQYPSIKIEYLGGPLYVPPSSDPNYDDGEK